MNKLGEKSLRNAGVQLPTGAQSAGIGVVRGAHRRGYCADLGYRDPGLIGGGGDLGGGSCTGDDEGEYEESNDSFHLKHLLSCIYV
jgi:hypothetical protein